MSRVSSHPVLPHQGDDAGRRTRLRQEGVFEELAGRGPLSRVAHQHPVQEALQQRGDLGERERGNIQAQVGVCDTILWVCEGLSVEFLLHFGPV